MNDNRNNVPMWVGGILLALLLILLSNAGGGPANSVLIQRFAPTPTDPNMPTEQPFELPLVHLPSLPPAMQDFYSKLRDRFASGVAVPALTPTASGPRAKVEIKEIQRAGDHVQVRGSVTNISNAPLTIPSGAFSFRDSSGIAYATSGGDSTLQPSQSTTLDLGVPLPAGRGITLILTLPPDQTLEQVLFVETTS